MIKLCRGWAARRPASKLSLFDFGSTRTYQTPLTLEILDAANRVANKDSTHMDSK